MVPAVSDRIPRVPPYSGTHTDQSNPTCTGLSPSAVDLSRSFQLCESVIIVVLLPRHCRNSNGLGSFHFARHYFGNRFFFLFLRVMRCFSSPGWPQLSWCQAFSLTGCPIQIRADQVLFADPRTFSQLTTSFLASRSLGILCSPFVTSSCEPDRSRSPSLFSRNCSP